MNPRKKRLDVLLVERKLAESREKAKRLILAGLVKVKNVPLPKPGMTLPGDAEIIVHETEKYVGRGGYKLEAALDKFPVMVKDMTCIDIGASTGGFTDCLLQRGAGKVYAVDVGYGQLHPDMRHHPKVKVMERVNARNLSPDIITEKIDLAVIDVSFISLNLILPSLKTFLKSDGDCIALVKPQFEAGPSEVPKGGVIKNPATHEKVLTEFLSYLSGTGWFIRGLIPSPVKGASGNREYLALFSTAEKSPVEEIIVEKVVSDAFKE